MDDKYLNPAEAGDYIDVYLKRRGILAYAPHWTVKGIHGYYWERLAQLIPSFPGAWHTAIYGRETFVSGSEIMRHVQSFYTRLLSMFHAKDNIADQYYRRSDADVEWRMMR